MDLAAQEPSATFTYPTNNSIDVNLRPGIIIKTNLKIDSSSVTWEYPNLDSTIFQNPVPPTIMLIEKNVRDSIPDSLWQGLSIEGEYEILSDTILKFLPLFKISTNTEYTAILSNLKVLKN